MAIEMKGRSVLITGGAAGIGLATAREFARAGSRLFLVDINEAALQEAARELCAAGAEVEVFTADVADRAAVQRLAETVSAKSGGLDILINNAGVGYNGELAEMRLEDWKRLLDINLWGALNFTYTFLPEMIKRRSGGIVNISSGQAFFQLPSWGAYAAIKTGLGVFSELLHFEVKKHGVRVTTVYPYMANTGFYQGVEGETWLARQSMKLLPYYAQKPETVGRIVFRAARRGKRLSLVHPFNRIGRLIRGIPPLAWLFTLAANRYLTKRGV